MRVKRAIVVGDPLQIPPVVSFPERLVTEICQYFSVQQEEWAAPEASVQTLADQASRHQAEFRADVGTRKVGLPLLVHRRCQEPMFGISNSIAYDGQMVFASGTAPGGQIGKALGPSAWIDVDGTASTKWCAGEGAVVVRLLERLAAAGVRQPDLYVITPFRIVMQEMRRLLESRQDLFDQFEVEAGDWIQNRVGTIHTFQGKEAEAVITVLCAPMANQQGARRWAASTPNILNVMVSRAKQQVYVVGSRAAWGSVGHARALASALPTQRH
jgi:superfamily I DNA and/or RNA helicase